MTKTKRAAFTFEIDFESVLNDLMGPNPYDAMQWAKAELEAYAVSLEDVEILEVELVSRVGDQATLKVDLLGVSQKELDAKFFA